MKCGYFLVLTWLGLFQSASAQTMKAINLEPGDKLINQGVNISIDFTSEKKPWCGLRVDWGNGKTQPVRVGHDGDEGAPTSPIKLSNTYNTPGKYNIIVKGELLVRGLTGTALPCEVKTSAAEVVVIDPAGGSLVGVLETESGKAARLTNEIEFKEKENQRALETERQRAAELKANKDAEEALLRMWKDAGFAVSQLPSCSPKGALDNCFGSGKDSNGVEYVGEFKNNSLVGKGIVTYKGGNRYIGEYNGGLNGEGIFYYLAENQYKGMIFVGRYKNNMQAGNGIYFDRSGNVVESGLYESNKLVENRYVDPATFTRIPAGKIPVISASARLKIESKLTVTPNISIVTSVPKFPNRPSAGAYEMMQVRGNASNGTAIILQIFSDGQAPFISNGESAFLMHTGNGIFVDQDNKIILDEKNSQLSINNVIVKGIQFTKSAPPPPPSSQTFGENLRFWGELSKATDETDLMVGCSAAALLGSEREWANKTTLADARRFGLCLSMSAMASDKSYTQRFSAWKEKLNNENTYSLFKYTERCNKDYIVKMITKQNSAGQYSQECAGVSINH